MTPFRPQRGHDYEWVGPTVTLQLGRLIEVQPDGLLRFEAMTCHADVRIREVKRPLFGGRR